MNVRGNPPLLILPWVAFGLALWGLHFLIEGGEPTGPTFILALVYWVGLTLAWYFIVRDRVSSRS